MVQIKNFAFFSAIILATCLMGELQRSAAMRPLRVQTVYSAAAMLGSSLHKGTVPPSGNPCTQIPNKGSGICKFLEGKDFAGIRRADHQPPAAYPTPDASISFGAASLPDETSNHKDH